MKYLTPSYEIEIFESDEIIMSDEAGYVVEESKDESGNTVGDIIIGADSLFKQYFN